MSRDERSSVFWAGMAVGVAIGAVAFMVVTEIADHFAPRGREALLTRIRALEAERAAQLREF
jgi:hypothetical protein